MVNILFVCESNRIASKMAAAYLAGKLKSLGATDFNVQSAESQFAQPPLKPVDTKGFTNHIVVCLISNCLFSGTGFALPTTL